MKSFSVTGSAKWGEADDLILPKPCLNPWPSLKMLITLWVSCNGRSLLDGAAPKSSNMTFIFDPYTSLMTKDRLRPMLSGFRKFTYVLWGA